MESVLEFYREHSRMTEIITMKDMVRDVPQDIPSIVSTVQNVLLHQHWAERYSVKLEDRRNEEPWIRSVEEKLIFLNKSGYKHILDKKGIENKMIGICRDFSVMAVALCIEAGIPARARCGFATYFEPGKYMDHWVLEYWDDIRSRWILVDPQIDDFQRKKLDIHFNTPDVEEQYFITAPKAWMMCREKKLNPDLFGIFQFWGYDYLKCNLILDANSVLKMPMQPWDLWEGYKSLSVSEWSEDDYLIMDRLARYDLNVDKDLNSLYTFVQQNDKIKVPEDFSRVSNILS